VVSGACYGAYISGGQTVTDSIALRFLENGAYAFIGSTATTYSTDYAEVEQVKMDEAMADTSFDEPAPVQVGGDVVDMIFGRRWEIEIPLSPLDRGQQHFDWLVLSGIAHNGLSPLDSYLQAKRKFTELEYQTCGEKKARFSYVYYGLAP